jgi:hypothetical protein
MVEKVHIRVFCVVTPCSLVGGYQCFSETCYQISGRDITTVSSESLDFSVKFEAAAGLGIVREDGARSVCNLQRVLTMVYEYNTQNYWVLDFFPHSVF